MHLQKTNNKNKMFSQKSRLTAQRCLVNYDYFFSAISGRKLQISI